MDFQWQFPKFEIQEFKKKKSKYCLCIFVLNENGRLHSELKKLDSIVNQIDIIIADGGSTDSSTGEAALVPLGVRTLLTKTGAGALGAQMRMAFSYAFQESYMGVIVVDGNDKDDVIKGLPEFLKKLEDGFDHIQGSRYIKGGHHENTPVTRHFGVRFIHAPLVSLAAGFRYTDTTNGFRAYSSKFLRDARVAVFRDVLSGYELHYYLAIKAARLNFKVCEIPVTRIYPQSGKTPTKISPLTGNAKIVVTLLKTIIGAYEPK